LFYKVCVISEITAEICDVPPQLVKNFHIIWSVLACGFAIDSDKFKELCQQTLDIYFDDQIGVAWCQFHQQTF
jgi:hypothetical protein